MQLFDRPSDFTARRMADGVWAAITAPLVGSLALLVGTAVGAATNTLSGMLLAHVPGNVRCDQHLNCMSDGEG